MRYVALDKSLLHRHDLDFLCNSQYHQTLDEILFANIDVTSVAQAWLLVDIGLHVDIQEQLRAEVLTVNDEDSKALEAYLSSTSNLMHLVHSESARLHPVLWYNIPEGERFAPMEEFQG